MVASLISLGACQGPGVTEYADNTPELNPERFFVGKLSAHGIVKDYTNTVTRRFNADIDACWQDGVGTLDESFVFDDGEKQKRFWTLEPLGNKRFKATAGDVVGEGAAEWSGNSLFLDYVLRVALEDGDIDLRIDDRMYLVNDTVLINESTMKKFGLPVGKIVLTIIRHPEQPVSCSAN
jgi:hypothetical protein